MVTKVLIGMAAAALAIQDETGLHPESLYNGVDRPVVIRVDPPGPAASVRLALLDADGGVLAGPVEVLRGGVDLAAIMPEVWRLRRAAWLQMLAGDDPIGAPLVVQPMLSRLVPVTEDAVSPSGIHYTRIVRWYDEMDPRGAEAAVAAHALDRAWLDPPGASAGDRRLLSSLRVYPDRDVVLRTSEGAIRLAMRPDQAPNTAWNFLELCRGGFYRDVVFHRIVPMTPAGDPFVIQAGDPTASGSGGPGYWLPIEPSGLPHDFGVISMARDVDPDSAGSQIFICLSRAGTARLDGHYCAFGEAVSGADTIRAIAGAELADVAEGRPAAPPVIEAAELVPAEPRTPGEGRSDRPLHERAETPAPPERVPR